MSNQRSTLYLILSIIIAALIIAGGVYYYNLKEAQRQEELARSIPKPPADIEKEIPEQPKNEPKIETLSPGTYPPLGSATAPITMVEFADFQCPFCASFFNGAFKKIKANYINTGKVKFYFRDFPFSNLHPDAQKAHQAARCALEQDAFWDIHNKLFENQDHLKIKDLKGYAEQLGLDLEKFSACLASGKYKDAVAADFKTGRDFGVDSTPSFFIGWGDIKVDVANLDLIKSQVADHGTAELESGWLVVGAKEFETFKELIENMKN